jgi:hypothetical protein
MSEALVQIPGLPQKNRGKDGRKGTERQGREGKGKGKETREGGSPVNAQSCHSQTVTHGLSLFHTHAHTQSYQIYSLVSHTQPFTHSLSQAHTQNPVIHTQLCHTHIL